MARGTLLLRRHGPTALKVSRSWSWWRGSAALTLLFHLLPVPVCGHGGWHCLPWCHGASPAVSPAPVVVALYSVFLHASGNPSAIVTTFGVSVATFAKTVLYDPAPAYGWLTHPHPLLACVRLVMLQRYPTGTAVPLRGIRPAG